MHACTSRWAQTVQDCSTQHWVTHLQGLVTMQPGTACCGVGMMEAAYLWHAQQQTLDDSRGGAAHPVRLTHHQGHTFAQQALHALWVLRPSRLLCTRSCRPYLVVMRTGCSHRMRTPATIGSCYTGSRAPADCWRSAVPAPCC